MAELVVLLGRVHIWLTWCNCSAEFCNRCAIYIHGWQNVTQPSLWWQCMQSTVHTWLTSWQLQCRMNTRMTSRVIWLHFKSVHDWHPCDCSAEVHAWGPSYDRRQQWPHSPGLQERSHRTTGVAPLQARGHYICMLYVQYFFKGHSKEFFASDFKINELLQSPFFNLKAFWIWLRIQEEICGFWLTRLYRFKLELILPTLFNMESCDSLHRL